jgi:dipeptidyl aminopeptidase/acylaminoacyl peptidase
MSRTFRVSLAASIAFIVSVHALGESRTARLTLEDLVSVPAVGNPVLSPDGKQFALIRDGQIALMPADGGWPVTLTTTPGAKSEVSWSPDASMLAFVSQGAIWVVSAAGGPPKQLTDGVRGPGDPRGAADRTPRWCPKGQWILFETGRRGQNELMVVSADGRTTNALAATEVYGGADRLSDDDRGDAVSGDRFDPSPAWSPDGTRIVYTERAREYFAGKLKLLPFDLATGRATGNPTELYTARPDRGGAWAIDAPAWSPDGRTLAIVLQDSGWDKVYLLSANGGAPRALTSGDGEDLNPVFSPDGRSLAIVSNRLHLEQRRIWIVPVDGSAPRQLTDLPAGVESNVQWSPDGAKIFFLRSAPLDSQNLYVASATGPAKARPLTRTLPVNFERAGLDTPAVVHFKGRDGLDLAGILYRPVGYQAGVRYPAVIWAHGGPEGQDTLAFAPWELFLSQEGYVVLRPNYRGSNGYGERFRNLNVEDSGGGEVDDVGAAAQYLIDQGLADPKRIAIGGGSHGGTMVNYAMTKLPGVFCAGLDLYGVADRATYNERTNRNSAIRWEIKMGGKPAEKPAVYRKANVLPDVAKIAAPMLVIHGQEDPQVPPYESAQLVEALKKHGKTVYYFTYPREGHGISEREHRLDAWRKQQAFLQKYLQPVYGQSITAIDEQLTSHK